MSCYNRCDGCLCNSRLGEEANGEIFVDQPRCTSKKREAKFYHQQIQFNYDTSRCIGFKPNHTQ